MAKKAKHTKGHPAAAAAIDGAVGELQKKLQAAIFAGPEDETPVVKLGPGGDYVQEIKPSDLLPAEDEEESKYRPAKPTRKLKKGEKVFRVAQAQYVTKIVYFGHTVIATSEEEALEKVQNGTTPEGFEDVALDETYGAGNLIWSEYGTSAAGICKDESEEAFLDAAYLAEDELPDI